MKKLSIEVTSEGDGFIGSVFLGNETIFSHNADTSTECVMKCKMYVYDNNLNKKEYAID